jgi:phosphatidylethanolamine-binding protein (PEBP) family uncharacterized protein
MGRLLNVTVSALALVVLVAGCGGSSSTSQPSSTQTGNVSRSSSVARTSTSATTPAATGTTATDTHTSESPSKEPKITIALSSPALEGKARKIPARYTCDGADVSPPLNWNAIPPHTAELVLLVVDLNESAPAGGPLISWAVAGLRPTLKGFATGALPAGAIVGRNSLGQSRYSICPPKGGTHDYLASLFGLEHPVSVKPGFDAYTLYKTVVSTAEHEGWLGFSYKRA